MEEIAKELCKLNENLLKFYSVYIDELKRKDEFNHQLNNRLYELTKEIQDLKFKVERK